MDFSSDSCEQAQRIFDDRGSKLSQQLLSATAAGSSSTLPEIQRMAHAAVALGLKETVATAQRNWASRMHACASRVQLELREMLADFERGCLELHGASRQWLKDTDGQCMEPARVIGWLQSVMAVETTAMECSTPGRLDVEEIEKMAKFPGKLGPSQQSGGIAALVTAALEAARLRQISTATVMLEMMLVATRRWAAGRAVSGVTASVDLDYFGSPHAVSSTMSRAFGPAGETLLPESCCWACKSSTMNGSFHGQAMPPQQHDELLGTVQTSTAGSASVSKLHALAAPLSMGLQTVERSVMTDPVLAVLHSLEHRLAPRLLFAPLLAPEKAVSARISGNIPHTGLLQDLADPTTPPSGAVARQLCAVAGDAEATIASASRVPLEVQRGSSEDADGNALGPLVCTHPLSAAAPLRVAQLLACAGSSSVEALPELSLAFEALSDIAILPCHCPALRCLNLCANHVHDLAPLRPLAGTLCCLDLSENGLRTLGAITSLSVLQYLNLDRNHLSSLSGARQCTVQSVWPKVTRYWHSATLLICRPHSLMMWNLTCHM